MHCVVVGSGVTGLSCALLLAKCASRVTVLEAGPRLAPILRGFTREGLHFDTGLHLAGGLHQGGLLARWLTALGLWQHLSGLTTSACEHFHFACGTKSQLPAGLPALLAYVEESFPGSAAKLRTFLTTLEAEIEDSPYINPRSLGEPQLGDFTERSFLDLLKTFAFPKALEIMLKTRCLLYGVSPEAAGVRDYALVAGPYFHSAGCWEGTGSALFSAYLSELKQAGVTLRTNARVTAILAQKGQGVTGLALSDGSTLACDRIFFTGHPRQLEDLLPRGLLRPCYCKRIRDLPDSKKAILLFCEIREQLFAGESLYLLPELEAPDHLPPASHAQPLLSFFQGRPDRTGRRTLTVISLLPDLPHPPLDAISYQRQKAACVEHLRACAEARLPGLKKSWRILAAATPHTFRRYSYGSTGSLYGAAHLKNNLPLLPATRLPGLFLAGQSILLPGMLGSIISAALAAGLAFGHATVLKEFRACGENASS